MTMLLDRYNEQDPARSEPEAAAAASSSSASTAAISIDQSRQPRNTKKPAMPSVVHPQTQNMSGPLFNMSGGTVNYHNHQAAPSAAAAACNVDATESLRVASATMFEKIKKDKRLEGKKYRLALQNASAPFFDRYRAEGDRFQDNRRNSSEQSSRSSEAAVAQAMQAHLQPVEGEYWDFTPRGNNEVNQVNKAPYACTCAIVCVCVYYGEIADIILVMHLFFSFCRG